MGRFLTWFLFIPIAFLSIPETRGQATEKKLHRREQFWLGYLNQTRLTQKFGIWMDIHYRQTGDFVDRPFQFLFRPAITYFIKENIRINVGYTFVNHFPGKGLSTSRPEHRAWQQIWWNQKYSGFTTLQWLRFEQRFNRKIANDVLDDDYNFNYRIRYNLAFLVPLKGKEVVPKTPFLAVMNELFLNFGERIVYNTFDQNRVFAGIGYQFNAHLNAQLGYMNIFQQEDSGSNYLTIHTIRLSFFHAMDMRNKD